MSCNFCARASLLLPWFNCYYMTQIVSIGELRIWRDEKSELDGSLAEERKDFSPTRGRKEEAGGLMIEFNGNSGSEHGKKTRAPYCARATD